MKIYVPFSHFSPWIFLFRVPGQKAEPLLKNYQKDDLLFKFFLKFFKCSFLSEPEKSQLHIVLFLVIYPEILNISLDQAIPIRVHV